MNLIADLKRFRIDGTCGQVVMINLPSTERQPDACAQALRSPDAFERGLDRNDAEISEAILYACAAIQVGVPCGNFTPSVGVDVPALTTPARELGVPIEAAPSCRLVVVPIPEPAQRALMLVGFGIIGGAVRLRHRAALAMARPAVHASVHADGAKTCQHLGCSKQP